MTERIKYEKRVSFARGAQTKFIISIEKKLDLGLSELAQITKVNRRTIYDWKREKFSMSLPSLKKLCLRAGIPIPHSIQVKDSFWYVSNGGKVGGMAVMKKYGRVPVDSEYRKDQWRQWWELKGKFTPRKIYTPLPFKKIVISNELAEFMGIMMGDGGMSNYQISITLHHIDDKKYGQYVARLMKKLFGIMPTIRHIPKISVNTYTISRTELVKHLYVLGLVIGNKVRQQINIPLWIKKNDTYLKACIRGLVDTDGCLVRHKYKVNGKYYFYKKLCFTTASDPLRKTVFDVFKKWGFNPRISQNRDVRLENNKDMKNYFRLINSHNPKHLKKYYNEVKW